MKLLIKKVRKTGNFIQVDDDIRRVFIKNKQFKAWALYEEFLSHKDNTSISKKK